MPSNGHQEQFQSKGEELMPSPGKIITKNFTGLETKPLPLPKGERVPDEDFVHEFSRNDIRELIHLITQELKLKGTKTPNVFLAFRSRLKNSDLTDFLEHTLIAGKVPASNSTMERFVREADEFTLVGALKYLWARLPAGSVIGWDAYDSFKDLEEREHYPKKAFLEFMPQCLSSPSHASIVYDFLDLIVSMAANAKENLMSGRKLAKMCAIWAFHGPPNSYNKKSRSAHPESSFTEGLKNWIPGANAMFHLLLSFLRSMLPDDHHTKLQLPRNLQALLASNSYPPPDLTSPSKHMIEVPLVTIRTNHLSNSPIAMLNRVPKILSFDNPDLFQAKEDYALLKAFCQKDGNILSRLSSESRKVLELMSQTKSDNALKAGWPTYNRPVDDKGQKETTVAVSRVPIEDYFVWAWSASISFEQTAPKKRLFGRSLIQEVTFDGYKKTIIIEEQNMCSSDRNNQPPLPDIPTKTDTRVVSQPHYKSMLDDLQNIDEEAAAKEKLKKKKKPKTKALQESNQQHSKGIMMYDSPKLAGLLKKKHGRREMVAPAPPLKDPSLPGLPLTYEAVQLPEIEEGQYRLSIPLDGFGFDEYQPQESQQEQYEDQQYYDYQSKDAGYYRSLEPTLSSDEPYYDWTNKEIEANPGNTQASASGPHKSPFTSGRTTLDIPSNGPSHVSALNLHIPSPESSYDVYHPPSSPGRQSGYRDSMESLSNMVSEISVQVTQVGRKLGKDDFIDIPPKFDGMAPEKQKTRPNNLISADTGYHFQPQEKSRSSQSHAEATTHDEHQAQKETKLPPMYEVHTTVKQSLRPIGSISPDPTNNTLKENEGPASNLVETVSLQGNGYSPERPKLSPILTKNAEIKGRRKPPSDDEDFEESSAYGSMSNVSSNPYGPSSSIYGPTPIADSFMNNGLTKISSPSNYDTSDYQSIPTVEKVNSREDRPKRTTVLSNNTERDSYYTADTNDNANTDYELVDSDDKRFSSQSQKYPGSIIDTYRHSAIPTPTSARGNFPRDDESKSTSFSIADTSYIPEAVVPDEEIPVPEIPKSPIRKRKPVPVSPERMQQNELKPLPKLSYGDSQDGMGSEYRTAASSEYEHCQAAVPSPESEFDDRNEQPYSGAKLSSYSMKQPIAEKLVHQNHNQRTLDGKFRTAITSSDYVHQIPIQGLQKDQRQSQEAEARENNGNLLPHHQLSPQQTYKQFSPHNQPQPQPQQYPHDQRISERRRSPQAPLNIRNTNSPKTASPGSASSPNHQQHSQRAPQSKVQQPNLNPIFTPHRQQANSPNNYGLRHSSPYNQGQPMKNQAYPYQEPSNGPGSSLQLLPQNYPYKNSHGHSQEVRGRSPQSMDPRRSNSPSANSVSSRGKAHQQPSPQQQHYNYPPPPQGYYPAPPQGYYPPLPQGYYPPPPQGYPPQGGYYPPPPQGWYPPPPAGYAGFPPSPSPASGSSGKSKTASEVVMGNAPPAITMNKLHHRAKAGKKDMRAALTQGDFGI